MAKTCHNCGTQMAAERLEEYITTRLDGASVVCGDVPVMRCPRCGETLLSAEVQDLLDRVRRGLVAPTETVTIQLPKVRLEDLLAAA